MSVPRAVERIPKFRRWALAIVFVAFALRLSFFRAIAAHPERFFQPDSAGYHDLALNLLRFHRFGEYDAAGVWSPHVNRTPAYPLFLAAVYALFGLTPAAVMLLQVMISTLCVALTFWLARLWAGARVGVWAAAWLSVEVGSVIYANQVMTETLFSCTLLGAMIVWSVIVRRARWRRAFLCGALLGAGALIRPVLLYFALAVGVLTVALYPARGRWRAALTMLLAVGLIVAPWMTRNYAIMQRAELSVIQARNLFFFNVGHLRAARQHISYQEARVQLEQEARGELADEVLEHPGRLADYYQRKAVSEIRANWVDYAVVHLKGAALFFVIPTAGTVARALGWVRVRTGLLSNLMGRALDDTWRSFRDFHRQLGHVGDADWLFFGAVGYELLYLAAIDLCALWGAVTCLRDRRWGVLLLTLAVIGYFAMITGPVSYDARYRIPAIPFLALLAGLGQADLGARWRRIKSRKKDVQ